MELEDMGRGSAFFAGQNWIVGEGDGDMGTGGEGRGGDRTGWRGVGGGGRPTSRRQFIRPKSAGPAGEEECPLAPCRLP